MELIDMSTLPHFLKGKKDNPYWLKLREQHSHWMEKKISSLLKRESKAIRYTYGYLRYVDKNNRGFAYPAQATIAKAVKVSPRHVIRCLSRLVEIGLILKGKKSGHSYYIFTLPSSLKDLKSPLEKNLEKIDQEVLSLGKQSLKVFKQQDGTYEKVISKCHINNNKIYNKIGQNAANKQEKKTHFYPDLKKKTTIKELKTNLLSEEWWNWIEKKGSLTLSAIELKAKKEKENELLEKRRKKNPQFPLTLLKRNLDMMSLSWTLKKYRNITYFREIKKSMEKKTL